MFRGSVSSDRLTLEPRDSPLYPETWWKCGCRESQKKTRDRKAPIPDPKMTQTDTALA
jgi:hypothetical protein